MKQLVRVFALLLTLTFVLGAVSFPASAEEGSEESSCKVLIWTDASGEHVIPYTDFTGWDRTMAGIIGSTEYNAYAVGGGGYSDYYAAGFRGRWISSDPLGVVGVAIVQADNSQDGNNAYEVKINNAYSFVWNSTATGGSTEYPIKAIIFYNPNSTTDDPVYESIDTTQLNRAWSYDPWTVACHVSGQDGAALYAAVQNGIVTLQVEVREHDYQGNTCAVCGAEAPPCEHPNGYDEVTGICPDCEGVVPLASVEAGGTKTFYTEFQDALDAWVDGSTLTLLNDIPDGTVTETIELTNKTVTLDLGGHILDMSSVSTAIQVGKRESLGMIVPGGLTIRSSGENGQLKAGLTAVAVYDRMTLESGKLTGRIYASMGITNMTGGSVEGTKDSSAVAIENGAQFHISGGTLSDRYGIWNNGTVTVSGSPVITGTDMNEKNGGAALANIGGTMTISGSPILTGGSQGELMVWDPITLNTQPADGETWSVYMGTPGTFAVPGEGMDLDVARFTSAKENCYVAENEDGSLVLMICDHTEEVTVSNGDGTHDIVCPCGSTVIQDNAACSGGEASCKGKAVCSVCGSEYGSILSHTFSPATGKCLACGEPMAEASLTIARLTTYYESVQEAANAGFNSRHTVTLCKDVNLSGYLTINEGCTLDLAGWTLSSDSYMALYVAGNAQLVSSGKAGTIRAGGSPGWGVWVQGDLTVADNVAITATTASFYYNSGVLDLTAVSDPTGYTIGVDSKTGMYDLVKLPGGYALFNGSDVVGRLDTVSGAALTIGLCTRHEVDGNGICTLCGYQYAACVTTVDGITDYYTMPDALNAANSNDGSVLKLLKDITEEDMEDASALLMTGNCTLDLGGKTLGVRIWNIDAILTVVDTAETKGTIVNSGGAAFVYSGGRIIIDASTDCTGEADGHEDWIIQQGSSEDVGIGTTGTEDIVIPAGCVAVDLNRKNEVSALPMQTGGVVIHRHADNNMDHACDNGCGITQGGIHKAAQGSHNCAYCGKEASRCADDNKDHLCDVCGDELSQCADANKDHNCDVCGDKLSDCGDKNKDGKCDVCGASLLDPAPEKPYKIANVVSGVHVYWKATQGAVKYGLWRSETGKNGTYKWVANPTVPHFTDTKVETGKTYYYKVTTMNAAGQHSEKSEAIGIVYVGTPDITSRFNKAAGITLGWNKIQGATGYAIYRKTYHGTDAWVRIATIEGNQTFTWQDTSVKNNNGSAYKYTIRALAGADMKTLSGCRNAGRSMVRLTSRTLSSAVKASATSIKCTWTTSAVVTGYEVRFMVGSTVYKTFTVGNYKTGVKTFTGLEKGKTYKIQVRSYVKIDGMGFYSAWSTAKTVKL